MILDHVASEIRFIRRMVAGPSAAEPVVDNEQLDDEAEADDEPDLTLHPSHANAAGADEQGDAARLCMSRS